MKKTITVALAVAALVGAVAVSTKDAEARRFHHRGIGIGLGLGLLGAGVAYGAPAYYEPAYDCEWVERYDRRGRYLGTRKICRALPY